MKQASYPPHDSPTKDRSHRFVVFPGGNLSIRVSKKAFFSPILQDRSEKWSVFLFLFNDCDLPCTKNIIAHANHKNGFHDVVFVFRHKCRWTLRQSRCVPSWTTSSTSEICPWLHTSITANRRWLMYVVDVITICNIGMILLNICNKLTCYSISVIPIYWHMI